MQNITQLFTGDLLIPTLIVAFAAFILGFLLEMVLAKVCCSRSASSSAYARSDRPRQDRAQQPRPERRHPAPADGSIEIYVGNLSYEMTDEALRKEFEAYGKVNSARIIVNRFNGKSKGFGFVHMPDKDEVEAAIKALSDKEVLGRRLKCNVARNV